MRRLFFITVLSSLFSLAFGMQTLFYSNHDLSDYSFSSDKIIHEIQQRRSLIDIVAPQVYELAANGLITGSIDSSLLSDSKRDHLKLMPLIINKGFKQPQLTAFFNHPAAEQRAIAGMLMLCQRYHLYGIQLDFENINLNDRSAYTQFFAKAASVLHKNGFAISATVVPFIRHAPNYTAYNSWYKSNWNGAYDLAGLAKQADFITIMTYDKHTSYTTPGPIAPLHWVKAVITSALKVVPANKISLGIPAYSGLWRTDSLGDHFQAREHQISYTQAMQLVKKFKATLVWNATSQSASTSFEHHFLNEYLFLENAESFKAKLALAKKYQLRGISVWQLGQEDPAIWQVLKSTRGV